MEVAKQHGGLGACDHQDDEHQEQETEHVVHLGKKQNIQIDYT